MCAAAGFSDARLGHIDLIVSELVTNLVKHGGGGELMVAMIEEHGSQGIEIVSVDNGLGIEDVALMTKDGMSTKRTLGLGLGTIKRMSDLLQIYSIKDWGTIMLVRVFETEAPLFKKASPIEIRSLVVAKPGETACGDAFAQVITSDEIRLFLGDGLGHGADAEKAVLTACDAFRNSTEKSAVDVLRSINDAVRKTRGLVGTVAIFDMSRKVWKVCGVGNIMTRITSQGAGRSNMPYNGIIGLNVPRTLNEHEVPYEKGQQLIMCSDGMKSKWDTLKYYSIFRYDATVACAALLKDYARQTDDMSIAICKLSI